MERLETTMHRIGSSVADIIDESGLFSDGTDGKPNEIYPPIYITRTSGTDMVKNESKLVRRALPMHYMYQYCEHRRLYIYFLVVFKEHKTFS